MYPHEHCTIVLAIQTESERITINKGQQIIDRLEVSK